MTVFLNASEWLRTDLQIAEKWFLGKNQGQSAWPKVREAKDRASSGGKAWCWRPGTAEAARTLPPEGRIRVGPSNKCLWAGGGRESTPKGSTFFFLVGPWFNYGGRCRGCCCLSHRSGTVPWRRTTRTIRIMSKRIVTQNILMVGLPMAMQLQPGTLKMRWQWKRQQLHVA